MRRLGYLFPLILIVILVILPSCGRFMTIGTINVNATLDGAPWSGAVNYSYTSNKPGEVAIEGSAVPQSWAHIVTGTYTLYYHSGGPSGTTLASVTPSATQTLSTGGTITFTLNFSSAVQQ